ncbi:hypothetical protein GO755_16445 [Spirosoma sp. HMF4905]|uniref:Ig-like domain-containing protein n=1 Tax=Spirosoma arboris TaxID=2682092 RepID=A0A7K1SD86_9BACT|nr:hypothetical protein [Spirosoma arboris]MVM31638.1 hypothetical protein [Spirosoma arboris]
MKNRIIYMAGPIGWVWALALLLCHTLAFADVPTPPTTLPITCDYATAPANVVLTSTPVAASVTASYLLVDMTSGRIVSVNPATASFSNTPAGVYYAVAAYTSTTLVNATVGKLVSEVSDATGCVMWSQSVGIRVCSTTCDATTAPTSFTFTASTPPASATTTYVLINLATNTIAAISSTPTFSGVAAGDYEAMAVYTPGSFTAGVGASLYAYLNNITVNACGTGAVVSNGLFFKVCASVPPTIAITSPANTTTTSTNPPISGTATPLASVTVNAPGGQQCITTASAAGSWTCTSLTFTVGSQTVTAVASNTAGVSTTATTTFTVVSSCANPSVGGLVAFLGTLPLCNTTNAGNVTLSGNTGAVVKWQTSTDGGTTFTDITSTATGLSFTNAANNQQYRAVVNNGVGCANANSTPVTITTSAANCTVNCLVTPGVITK